MERPRRISGFGIFLVLLGGFLLAREYGLLPADLPWLPVTIIFFGLYLVLASLF